MKVLMKVDERKKDKWRKERKKRREGERKDRVTLT